MRYRYRFLICGTASTGLAVALVHLVYPIWGLWACYGLAALCGVVPPFVLDRVIRRREDRRAHEAWELQMPRGQRAMAEAISQAMSRRPRRRWP